MKIVHVSDLALPHIGGVEYVVYKYSTMQRNIGEKPVVITTKLFNTERREIKEGVPYYRLSKAGMIFAVLSLIKKINPDIVHTHS